MIPIFIITCDRLKILRESIQSYYDCIKTPFEISIINFGSTYKPTVEFLRDLERSGTVVYWNGRIKYIRHLNSQVGHNIQDYFKGHPASNYVVTDPDIALDNADGDILDVYSYLLDVLPEISTAGPMLRIDDIPDHYHNKKRVQTLHFRNFWSREINNIEYKNKVIEYINGNIDTTFGMNRAGTHWKRLRKGIRTMPPYSARHLDWYLDPRHLTPDQKHYVKHASKAVAHWSMEDFKL